MTVSPTLIRGSIQLALDCVSGITTAAESMHETIAYRATSWLNPISNFGPLKEIRKPTAYSMVRTTSDVLNKGIASTFAAVFDHSDLSSLDNSELPWVAALNGICGDHLEDNGNVLAIPMEFAAPSDTPYMESTQVPAASPHIVVMVHGLCLSEQCWHGDGDAGIGKQLKQELGMDPVYLRYNSGRHISSNGRDLARQLDDLCAGWPVPVESLSLVGYSMGGLVVRSACWYAEAEQRTWLKPLERILFLGSPHHGSPLEQAGHLVETALQSISYVEPLMFGRKRSAGIKDLRHGYLLDEDWEHPPGEKLNRDTGRDVPLLPSVDHYFIAASIGRHDKHPMSHLFGDLLVRVDSALGARSNNPGSFKVKKENCRVFRERNHFDLLIDKSVREQVVKWFRTPSPGGRGLKK